MTKIRGIRASMATSGSHPSTQTLHCLADTHTHTHTHTHKHTHTHTHSHTLTHTLSHTRTDTLRVVGGAYDQDPWHSRLDGHQRVAPLALRKP